MGPAETHHSTLRQITRWQLSQAELVSNLEHPTLQVASVCHVFVDLVEESVAQAWTDCLGASNCTDQGDHAKLLWRAKGVVTSRYCFSAADGELLWYVKRSAASHHMLHHHGAPPTGPAGLNTHLLLDAALPLYCCAGAYDRRAPAVRLLCITCVT